MPRRSRARGHAVQDAAADVIRRSGPALVGRSGVASDIIVVPRATAFECTFTVDGAAYTVILKRTATAGDAERLARVCERLTARNPELDRWLPRVLGVRDDWFALQFYPGRTLRDMIGRGVLDDVLTAVLARTGHGLARIHSIAGSDVDVTDCSPGNDEFMRTLRHLWAQTGLRPWLSGQFRTADAVIVRVPARVAARRPAQVLPFDSRPKNILVGSEGTVRFIDLWFAAGNPAHGLAAFLVAMDRMIFRRPTPGFERHVRRSQAAMIAAYAEIAPAAWIEDLVLYYPWVLLSMYRDHRRHRPVFTPLLAAFYTSRLKRFVRRLGDGDDWVKSPESLFIAGEERRRAWAVS